MSLEYKKNLIDIVATYPDLWKITKKAPNLKQKLWNEVGTTLGTTGFDARRQWEILRDQFRREYKRYIYDKSYVSKWMFYNEMLFVRHALKPKDCPLRYDEEYATVGTKLLEVDVSQMTDEKLSRPTAVEVDDLPKIQVRQDLQEGTDNSTHSQSTTLYDDFEAEHSPRAGISSSRQNAWFEESDCSSSNQRKRRWHCNRETIDEGGEDYYFVMSILPSLRSIKQIKKLRIRSKIMELIATELEADAETKQKLQMKIYPQPKTESEEVDDGFLRVALPKSK